MKKWTVNAAAPLTIGGFLLAHGIGALGVYLNIDALIFVSALLIALFGIWLVIQGIWSDKDKRLKSALLIFVFLYFVWVTKLFLSLE